jgi:hypothetical protein
MKPLADHRPKDSEARSEFLCDRYAAPRFCRMPSPTLARFTIPAHTRAVQGPPTPSPTPLTLSVVPPFAVCMPYSPTPSGLLAVLQTAQPQPAELSLDAEDAQLSKLCCPEHGTNHLFHVAQLQATFHLEALARPWQVAFCWLFHCSRRRGWVGRHVAWRSLTPPRLDLVDDGCGVAWCPFAAHAHVSLFEKTNVQGNSWQHATR